MKNRYLKELSIEELLDLEGKYHSDHIQDKRVDYYRLISVYEALYRGIKRDKNSEYALSLPSIKHKLIFFLVEYGTYLKTILQKDDYTAEQSLKKAIRYEPKLPIAYYRLGFLSYKRKQYTRALEYFQNAIRFQESISGNEYQLNEQQLHRCHLYLINCGLFIAEEAKRSLEKIELNAEAGGLELSNYPTSSLYQLIKENDRYLDSHAFQIVTNSGSRYCSRDECLDMAEVKDTIILDITGRENLLIFNGRERVLESRNQYEILRYFLLYSSENKPVVRHDLYDLNSHSGVSGEISRNTYTQNIGRLREALRQVGISEPVIITKRGYSDTAYYYNHCYPYMILQRIDETFLLVK